MRASARQRNARPFIAPAVDASASRASIAAPSPPTGDRFQREGEYWTVAYDGAVVRLKDSKGLRQIALLLAQPGRELHATDLESMVGGSTEAAAPAMKSRAAVRRGRDAPGLRRRGRPAGLRGQGRLQGPPGRAARGDRRGRGFQRPGPRREGPRRAGVPGARACAGRGPGGRGRKAASHAERARLNATRAIRSAMTNLAREHPVTRPSPHRHHPDRPLLLVHAGPAHAGRLAALRRLCCC